MHLALFLLLSVDPPAAEIEALKRRLAVAVQQTAYQSARADFAEAAHKATLADAAAAKAREWLDLAIKDEPGYVAGKCRYDQAAKMVCDK